MARPKTKPELLQASSESFDALWSLINSMTPKEQEATFDLSQFHSKKEAHWQRDKNLRDVLIHLFEWHQMLLHWVAQNTKGVNTPFLPEPFTWKTYGDLNVKLWAKHQKTPLKKSKSLIKQSHIATTKMMASFTDDALFTKKYFDWTGTTSLGSYCVSATCSHYEWALKKLKIQHKAYRQHAA